MDSFFLLPLMLFLGSFIVFCGCFGLCLYFAKKQGRFPTVNRNGPAHGRVIRSGPSFGANRGFGSGVTHNTPACDEMLNEDPPSVFIHNNLLITQDNPTIGSTDDATVVNTYAWDKTKYRVDELPPSYSDATGIPSEPRHQSQNGNCDISFRSHGNEHDGKCDRVETTYDSSGVCDSGGDSGGGGGDSGGGDSGGGGGGDTTTD